MTFKDSGRRAKALRALAALVIALVIVGVFLASFELGKMYDVDVPSGMMLTLFVSGVAGAVYEALTPRSTVASTRREAEVLEAKAESEETLVEYVEGQLLAAAKRQDAAVQRAESRGDRLSSIGSFLMIASVFAPLIFVILYVQLGRATTDGASPQRDWHLLLAGVSFGLLFIAAARGILVAEARQRDVYAREVRETAYYGDLRRALGMAQRIDREDKDEKQPATREVVRKIMALMLERGGREPVATAASEPAPTGEHEFLKIVTESIKK